MSNKPCDICGANPATQTRTTNAGEVGLCAGCNESMGNIQANAPAAPAKPKKMELPAPEEIRKYLDEYVIAQEAAKRVLSVAVYNHYKRVNYNLENEHNADADAGGIELKKSNILMVGPTGTGKTLITSTLARRLDVPFTMSDATSLLALGVTGSIEDILANLVAAADNDIDRAQRGIVYIDEIDKIATKYSSVGESLQQGLLKILEGTVMPVPIDGTYYQIDTHNILFIVGGAFVGLDVIVRNRIHGVNNLLNSSNLLEQAGPGDVVKFGMIPEFVGRCPVIVGLNDLDRATLINILTVPKNALVNQYKKMFALENIDLEFDQSALEKIADKALKLKTGARGLRTIIEERMLDIMYRVPSERNLDKVVITADVIDAKGTATFEYTQSKPALELPELRVKSGRGNTAPI